MDNFEKILRETVENNRRVIIPDLGAFISDPVENTVVFSTLLKNNDGLLESRLRASGIANPESLLENYVSNIVNTLDRGETFNIQDFGYLYMEGGNVQFNPVESQPDDGKDSQDSAENAAMKKAKAKVVIFLILAVLGLSLFFIYRFCLQAADNLTHVNPHSMFDVIETDSLTGFYGAESALFAGKQRYYVIAACFEEKINAEKFAVQCTRSGYPAAAVLPAIGNMFPVAVENSTSYIEAIKRKNEYDDKFCENTWIYGTR